MEPQVDEVEIEPPVEAAGMEPPVEADGMELPVEAAGIEPPKKSFSTSLFQNGYFFHTFIVHLTLVTTMFLCKKNVENRPKKIHQLKSSCTTVNM